MRTRSDVERTKAIRSRVDSILAQAMKTALWTASVTDGRLGGLEQSKQDSDSLVFPLVTDGSRTALGRQGRRVTRSREAWVAFSDTLIYCSKAQVWIENCRRQLWAAAELRREAAVPESAAGALQICFTISILRLQKSQLVQLFFAQNGEKACADCGDSLWRETA
eukprot:scaffold1384_cov256-Pinguiococcus_pyrenoidosus.AAC.13